MHHYLIDIKAAALIAIFSAVSFSEAEIGMKVIIFILTAGYHIHRWRRFAKEKKSDDEKNN